MSTVKAAHTAGHRCRFIVEAGSTLVGTALAIAPVFADQAWFDEHFVPVFFLTREQYVLGETLVRIAIAAVGLCIVFFARPVIGRLANRSTPQRLMAGAIRVLLAVLLALGSTELILRVTYSRATEEDPPRQEPLRRHDPILGWKFMPSREVTVSVRGRPVDYAFDNNGFRVESPADPVDPSKPTVLFAGESIMMGYGLQWDETIPTLVSSALNAQAVNMAVFAYADDQTYMRLENELPKFSNPVAAVILFSPGLVFRDFNHDRPYLTHGLIWHPAVEGFQLAKLLHYWIPYHSKEEIDRVIALVREELEAEVRLAHAHHAAVLVVVPHYGRPNAFETFLRHQILDQGHIPYAWIELDPSWRLSDGVHPNARGAQAISSLIVQRLGEQLAVDAASDVSAGISQ